MPSGDFPPWFLSTWPATTFVQQGWECPKCGHVYSPSMVMCSYCPQQATVTTSTGTACTCGTTAVCPLHNATPSRITCESGPGG